MSGIERATVTSTTSTTSTIPITPHTASATGVKQSAREYPLARWKIETAKQPPRTISARPINDVPQQEEGAAVRLVLSQPHYFIEMLDCMIGELHARKPALEGCLDAAGQLDPRLLGQKVSGHVAALEATHPTHQLVVRTRELLQSFDISMQPQLYADRLLSALKVLPKIQIAAAIKNLALLHRASQAMLAQAPRRSRSFNAWMLRTRKANPGKSGKSEKARTIGGVRNRALLDRSIAHVPGFEKKMAAFLAAGGGASNTATVSDMILYMACHSDEEFLRYVMDHRIRPSPSCPFDLLSSLRAIRLNHNISLDMCNQFAAYVEKHYVRQSEVSLFQPIGTLIAHGNSRLTHYFLNEQIVIPQNLQDRVQLLITAVQTNASPALLRRLIVRLNHVGTDLYSPRALQQIFLDWSQWGLMPHCFNAEGTDSGSLYLRGLVAALPEGAPLPASLRRELMGQGPRFCFSETVCDLIFHNVTTPSANEIRFAVQYASDACAARLLQDGRHTLNLTELLRTSVEKGRAETTKWLLKRGANPNSPDTWGHTPLVARILLSSDLPGVVRDPVIQILRSHGASVSTAIRHCGDARRSHQGSAQRSMTGRDVEGTLNESATQEAVLIAKLEAFRIEEKACQVAAEAARKAARKAAREAVRGVAKK